MDRLGVDGDCAACTCTVVGDALEDAEKDDRRATTLIDAVAAAPDDDDDGYPFLCLDADAPVVGRSHLFLRHWASTLTAEDGEPHFRLSLSLTKTATFLMDKLFGAAAATPPTERTVKRFRPHSPKLSTSPSTRQSLLPLSQCLSASSHRHGARMRRREGVLRWERGWHVLPVLLQSLSLSHSRAWRTASPEESRCGLAGLESRWSKAPNG